ncbi:MAG: extracellular solute-binding protein [Clostridia bacterium]|nr:extracellular solute-binding protein [Clostridia bacterium]
MKKIVRIFVLVLSILFVLCACQSEQPEVVPEYNPSADGSDLDGLELVWGFSMSRYNEGVDNVFGYIPGTAFADQALERKKAVESDLNCTITVDNDSSSYVIGDRLNASLASGSRLYDLATCDSSILRNLVRGGGYFIGLSSLLDVQNTDKWGTPSMLQMMLWENDLYGVVPFAWPDLLYSTTGHIFAVNESLISQLAQTDPREYVENLTWNWDKLEEVLEAYTYQDAGRTIYGMQCHDAYFAMNMFLSNGVAFSAYEDGKVVCGAYTDAGRVALERARQIYNETCKDYIYPDAHTNDGSYLVNGDVVMLVTGHGGLIGTESALLYQMDNIGVLPFPQGPNATPGVYASYYEQIAYTTSIPVNTVDSQAAALVLDAMFEPFEGLETKDDIADYLTDQVFFDKRDAEIFIETIANTEYGFFWEGGRSVIESAVSGNDNVSTLLESQESIYDQLVEDYLESHYAGRVAVYGE